ncbi:hypothetical protein KEM54_000596 [Ascosphaera aggregata]|nr:hypothetical protein KEM54_000596 [Ascosphaera aggregata]
MPTTSIRRVLSSQTIGVEFSSKIVKIGTGPRRKRIKLQLWDTAGTERFRSVSRSYYRGATGAILVYDVSSQVSFNSLPTFLMDARALASPSLTVLLAGNKTDLSSVDNLSSMSMVNSELSSSSFQDDGFSMATANSAGSLGTTDEFFMSTTTTTTTAAAFPGAANYTTAGGWTGNTSTTSLQTTTLATRRIPSPAISTADTTSAAAVSGREVSPYDASYWAAASNIPVAVEVSALTGEGVEELFNRLAKIILTKIELGEIDPDDPQSGIQYGDSGLYWDAGSTRSGGTMLDDMSIPAAGSGRRRRRNRGNRGSGGAWATNVREWEEVFRVNPRSKRSSCC